MTQGDIFLHILFGEMTITLDDVSSLLYLSIGVKFFIAHVISQKLACMMVVRDLGVSKESVLEEFEFNRGAHLQMS